MHHPSLLNWKQVLAQLLHISKNYQAGPYKVINHQAGPSITELNGLQSQKNGNVDSFSFALLVRPNSA